MREFLLERIKVLLRLAGSLDWLAPLMMRLFFGYFWLETGWGKLHNLAAFTQRFVGWGIPHPAFSAAVSGYTELIGGALIMAGLFTRLAAIPMTINMVVAIVTVQLSNIQTLDDFVEINEPLYILVFFWLMMAGPGRASLDYVLGRALGITAAPADARQ